MKHNLLFDIAKIFPTSPNEGSEEYTKQKPETRRDISIAPVFSSITILFYSILSSLAYYDEQIPKTCRGFYPVLFVPCETESIITEN